MVKSKTTQFADKENKKAIIKSANNQLRNSKTKYKHNNIERDSTVPINDTKILYQTQNNLNKDIIKNKFSIKESQKTVGNGKREKVSQFHKNIFPRSDSDVTDSGLVPKHSQRTTR